MAKLTVYLPDELAAEVSALSGRLNASRICREALQKEVHIMRTITNDNLARLRAERLRDVDHLHEEGRQCGVDWATDRGEFAAIRFIAEFVAQHNWSSLNVEEFEIFFDGREVRRLESQDQWDSGFVAGVVEVFDAVTAD